MLREDKLGFEGTSNTFNEPVEKEKLSKEDNLLDFLPESESFNYSSIRKALIDLLSKNETPNEFMEDSLHSIIKTTETFINSIKELSVLIETECRKNLGEKEIKLFEKNEFVEHGLRHLLSKLSELSRKNVVDSYQEFSSDLSRWFKVENGRVFGLMEVMTALINSRQLLLEEIIEESGGYNVMVSLFGDPEKYQSHTDLNQAIERGEISPWWMDDEPSPGKYLNNISTANLSAFINSLDLEVEKINEVLNNYSHLVEGDDPIDLKIKQKYEKELAQLENLKVRAFSVKHFQEELEVSLFDLSKEEPRFDGRFSTRFLPRRIAQTYESIVESAREVSQSAGKLVKDKNFSQVELEAVSDSLLKKANKLISSYAKKLSSRSLYDQEEESALISELALCSKEIFALSSVLQVMKSNGEKIDFDNDLVGVDMSSEEYNADRPLPSQEIYTLLEIINNNYRKIFSDNKDALSRVLSNFIKDINNPVGGRIFKMNHGGKIVAFCKLSFVSEGLMHAGSLNVLGEMQGTTAGTYLLEQALNEVNSSYDITAVSRKNNPANKRYLDMGFLINGEHEESDGASYYDLFLPRGGFQSS